MSEQPERMERWAIQYEDGEVCTSSSFEEAKKWDSDEATLKFCRLVELREGETIVGPLEMAVIEAAINHQKIADAFKAEDDEDILCALAKKSTAAQRTLEAAVRALREARR